MELILIFAAALFGAFGQNIDKHLSNLKTTRKDYFYYMCVTMLPYSLIMVIIEVLNNTFYFDFNVLIIILIILAMIFRYIKQHTIMGCLSHLNPYEDSAYLSLGIILSFILDCLISVQNITVYSVSSIFLILIGVFCVADSKFKISELKKDIVIRIVTSTIISYITFFALKYITNASYLFIVNILLVFIFAKNYTFSYHKENSKIIKWTFIQQLCGFTTLYLSNTLITSSVTLSNYVRPVSISLLVIFALFQKTKSSITSKKILGIILIIIGTITIS